MLEQPNDRVYFLQERQHTQPVNAEAVSARPGAIADITTVMNRRLGVYLAASQAAIAEKLGLSVTELKALELVQELGSLPTGQLAQLMGISWGGATALINRLEAAGYVERGRHPLDRRIIVIRPIKEKCQELELAQQTLADEVSFIGRQFDTQQLHAVQAFLTQYMRALRHDALAWLQTRPGSEIWND
jgi:DNA-binding MarR family transcriptional regulator